MANFASFKVIESQFGPDKIVTKIKRLNRKDMLAIQSKIDLSSLSDENKSDAGKQMLAVIDNVGDVIHMYAEVISSTATIDNKIPTISDIQDGSIFLPVLGHICAELLAFSILTPQEVSEVKKLERV